MWDVLRGNSGVGKTTYMYKRLLSDVEKGKRVILVVDVANEEEEETLCGVYARLLYALCTRYGMPYPKDRELLFNGDKLQVIVDALLPSKGQLVLALSPDLFELWVEPGASVYLTEETVEPERLDSQVQRTVERVARVKGVKLTVDIDGFVDEDVVCGLEVNVRQLFVREAEDTRCVVINDEERGVEWIHRVHARGV